MVIAVCDRYSAPTTELSTLNSCRVPIEGRLAWAMKFARAYIGDVATSPLPWVIGADPVHGPVARSGVGGSADVGVGVSKGFRYRHPRHQAHYVIRGLCYRGEIRKFAHLQRAPDGWRIRLHKLYLRSDVYRLRGAPDL